MVLSVAGNVDHDGIVRQAEKTFGAFSAYQGPAPQPAFYHGGELFLDRDFQEAQIVLGFEGRPYQVRDFYASQLLATVLGGGMSSRLFQEVREKRGLCYSIYAFHWAFSDSGVFGVHAATGEEDVKNLMPVIIDELLRAAESITETEVKRARAQIKSSLLMSMESPASRSGQIARQILLYGRVVTNEELNERLSAISAERLRELAERLFTQSNPTIVAVGPVSGAMRHEEIKGRLGYRPAAAAE
jgi:predicted Zn-dependent peptidase